MEKEISMQKYNYLEDVTRLVDRIKSLETELKQLAETIKSKELEENSFHFLWQKECNHPELYKITILPGPSSKDIPENNPNYPLIIKNYKKAGILDFPGFGPFYKCSVCKACLDITTSVSFVKELTLPAGDAVICDPISDLAKDLLKKKEHDLDLLKQEIKILASEKEEKEKELALLKGDAKKIVDILYDELRITKFEPTWPRPLSPYYGD